MSETPRRVQLSRAKGWRLPPSTVSVARPGKWGNPYPVTTTRANAVGAFAQWLETSQAGRQLVEAARRELRSKNLACWCPLDQPCHADVLLAIANAPIEAIAETPCASSP